MPRTVPNNGYAFFLMIQCFYMLTGEACQENINKSSDLAQRTVIFVSRQFSFLFLFSFKVKIFK